MTSSRRPSPSHSPARSITGSAINAHDASAANSATLLFRPGRPDTTWLHRKTDKTTYPMKNQNPLRRLQRLFALAAASTVAVLTAHAEPIAVQNHSFESPVTSDYIGVGQLAGANSLSNYGWNISGANTNDPIFIYYLPCCFPRFNPL